MMRTDPSVGKKRRTEGVVLGSQDYSSSCPPALTSFRSFLPNVYHAHLQILASALHTTTFPVNFVQCRSKWTLVGTCMHFSALALGYHWMRPFNSADVSRRCVRG